MNQSLSLFSVEPGYVIDTNVIVSFMHDDDEEAYGRYVFPQQWDVIEKGISSGHVIAPRRVEKELSDWEKAIPDLHNWLALHRYMFSDIFDDQLLFAKKVVNLYPDYGSSSNYIADLEVISLAGALGLAVITNEKVRPEVTINSPRIPEVCAAVGVDCLSVRGFLRQQLATPTHRKDEGQ